MNEYNTKITYYYCGQLQLKRTAKAYAKFYMRKYATILLNKLNRILENAATEPNQDGIAQSY